MNENMLDIFIHCIIDFRFTSPSCKCFSLNIAQMITACVISSTTVACIWFNNYYPKHVSVSLISSLVWLCFYSTGCFCYKSKLQSRIRHLKMLLTDRQAVQRACRPIDNITLITYSRRKLLIASHFSEYCEWLPFNFIFILIQLDFLYNYVYIYLSFVGSFKSITFHFISVLVYNTNLNNIHQKL